MNLKVFKELNDLFIKVRKAEIKINSYIISQNPNGWYRIEEANFDRLIIIFSKYSKSTNKIENYRFNVWGDKIDFIGFKEETILIKYRKYNSIETERYILNPLEMSLVDQVRMIPDNQYIEVKELKNYEI